MNISSIDERRPLAHIEQLRDMMLNLEITPQSIFNDIAGSEQEVAPQIQMKTKFEINTERMKF